MKFLDGICNSSTDSGVNSALNDISSSLTKFDTDLNKWTAQYMCTTKCPCNSMMNLNKWNEARLNEVNRTKNAFNQTYFN